MADFAAAITAIREACLGAIGSVRTVDADALAEGAYPHTAEHEAARALTGPSFEVEITDVVKHKDSPSEHSNVVLLDVTVQLRTEWGTDQELLDEERADARSAALSLLESARAALMRAGNLTSTSDSSATGIVSGCLHRFLGHRLELADWRGRRLAYLSRFATVIQFSQTAG